MHSVISNSLQRQIQRAQVFGGKSSVRGATSGTASSVAFTPLQVMYYTLTLCYLQTGAIHTMSCIILLYYFVNTGA